MANLDVSRILSFMTTDEVTQLREAAHAELIKRELVKITSLDAAKSVIMNCHFGDMHESEIGAFYFLKMNFASRHQDIDQLIELVKKVKKTVITPILDSPYGKACRELSDKLSTFV